MLTPLPLIENDPFLGPFESVLQDRYRRWEGRKLLIEQASGSLYQFAQVHTVLGLHYDKDQKGYWIREWAPNALAVFLTGEFNGWDRNSHPLHQNAERIWETFVPDSLMQHGMRYKLVIVSRAMGAMDRLPSAVRRVVQDDNTNDFAAQVWNPEKPYTFQNPRPTSDKPLLIYEAHIGMAQEDARVGTYVEFTQYILPRIAQAGYTALQLMALAEHPYYGSYGYHVSNYFAPSSRFGTPEELKELIDTAHGLGLRVVMDLVHSHSVKNLMEGLGQFDGSELYFIEGEAGRHQVWDSLLFDYGKWEVQAFLLSNLRYWLEEFQVDGFRFDGVTSMLYHGHGLNQSFGDYAHYFSQGVNEQALLYLQLANTLVKQMTPQAITIAEEVSGMPGLCRPCEEGGIGFDYRLAMGIPDFWVRMVEDFTDEEWDTGQIWGTLTNRRRGEKNIAYVESHDQAMMGDQTLAFRLIGPKMYTHMSVFQNDYAVDRGMALHKMVRLVTLSLGGEAWMSFIGNEFGHPEWIDFPRMENHWSHQYARRQWSLVDSDHLKYKFLGHFDQALMEWAQTAGFFEQEAQLLEIDHPAKVMGYTRGGWVFLYNWHPSQAWVEGVMPMPGPGKYQALFGTDEPRFGGFGLIDSATEYFTDAQGKARFYLPPRTALVLFNADKD